MDFIKKAADSIKGDSSKSDNKDSGSAKQQDDYVDKAFGAAVKQSGYGDKISRENQEKITDGGREAYEKYSGNKVSDKISN